MGKRQIDGGFEWQGRVDRRAEKPVLIGLSRGGFMAHRWASENTAKVAGVVVNVDHRLSVLRISCS